MSEYVGHKSASVQAIAAENAAAAVITYQNKRAYGGSKRNKNERKDASIGLDLAIGRAFINLGHDLIDAANDRLGD